MTPYSPFEVARALYDRYKLKPTFREDLRDHILTGKVRMNERCFAMAKAVELPDGRRAWMIAAAVGKLPDLLRLLPWQMPFIAFRRRGEKRVRVYSFTRLLHLASFRLNPEP